MEKVELQLDDQGKGHFYIMEEEKMIAEMVISISGDTLTVYHTEVVAEAEGKGLAKQMLTAMALYARQNKLKVVPLCPYVHAQFRRHAAEYQDIW